MAATDTESIRGFSMPAAPVATRPRKLALLLTLDALATFGILEFPLSPVANHAGSDPLSYVKLAALTVLALVSLATIGAYGHPVTRLGEVLGRYVRLFFVSGLVLFAASAGWVGAAGGTASEPAKFFILPAVWALTRVVSSRLTTRQADRTLILGTSTIATHVLSLMQRHGAGRIDVVGFVDDDPCELPEGAPRVIGQLANLPEICSAYRIDRIVVTFTMIPDAEILEALRECGDLNVRIQVVPRLFDLLGPQSSGFGNLGLIDVTRRRPAGVELAAKRAVDIAVSVVALTLTAPLIAAIALWIRFDDGHSPFFRQERVGLRGRLFSICKFRTMSSAPLEEEVQSMRLLSGGETSIADAVRELKDSGEMRVTKPGRFLRKTSLDELPQLWNVLRGEMSLVGPRPLQAYEVAALEPWQSPRQDVLPGVTGLWQILGRSDLDWHERQQLDFSYAHSWSLATDLRILAETIPAVFSRRGAR
jgi:exopolysaccharide biosynthesis polyprenyl glycosylphosphotransferase